MSAIAGKRGVAQTSRYPLRASFRLWSIVLAEVDGCAELIRADVGQGKQGSRTASITGTVTQVRRVSYNRWYLLCQLIYMSVANIFLIVAWWSSSMIPS